MSESFDYYMVREHHKEIFCHPEPVSFHELIFAVESPITFSEFDIWSFTEKLDIKDIAVHPSPIEPQEEEQYPYYDLLRILWEGDQLSPLIFEIVDNRLVCIEGRHRLRMMSLMYHHDPIEFDRRVGPVAAVVVYRIETRDYPTYPALYEEWCEWLANHSWKKEGLKRQLLYEKFLLNQ